jgi:putative NADH-flavin reductase
MKKKIVILGATGTVGSKIAEILLNEGHKVTVIARHTDTLEKFRPMGAVIMAGDVNDVEALINAFKNADSAFLILPDNPFAENTRGYQRQVTSNLVKAIENSGIKYIVNMSSVGSHMHEGNGMMARQTFLNNGFSPDFVDNLIEMGTAIKTGFMNYQKRNGSTTTATTAEEFINEVYLPAYNK